MKRFATLRNARLLQLVGLVIAFAGLSGFWLGRDVDRAFLTQQQRELLGIEEDSFHASFVVAGRDVFYSDQGQATPVYGAGGRIVAWNYSGPKSAAGIQTDTILYVSIVDDTVTMIAIPRDLFLDGSTRRINGVFHREGPDGLARRVEAILGLPIDYHAIIDLDIFQNLVDALGGVEVYVPERMYYRDNAANLTIDLQEGLQVLDGEQASDFIRYRQFQRGDIQRLDNVKSLAYAMLERVRQLNVRAVTVVPELADTLFADVMTNASPALVRQVLPRLPRLTIQSATLPTIEVVRDGAHGLEVDEQQVDAFLAATFGGAQRVFAGAPDANLLITNRSGIEGLEDWYRSRLIGYGVPEDRILVRSAPVDPTPTRLLATIPFWQEADYYTSLLHTGKQQIDRLSPFGRAEVNLELVLGDDALVAPGTVDLALAAPEAPR